MVSTMLFWITCSEESQLSCCETSQAALWRAPHGDTWSTSVCSHDHKSSWKHQVQASDKCSSSQYRDYNPRKSPEPMPPTNTPRFLTPQNSVRYSMIVILNHIWSNLLGSCLDYFSHCWDEIPEVPSLQLGKERFIQPTVWRGLIHNRVCSS